MDYSFSKKRFNYNKLRGLDDKFTASYQLVKGSMEQCTLAVDNNKFIIKSEEYKKLENIICKSSRCLYDFFTREPDYEILNTLRMNPVGYVLRMLYNRCLNQTSIYANHEELINKIVVQQNFNIYIFHIQEYFVIDIIDVDQVFIFRFAEYNKIYDILEFFLYSLLLLKLEGEELRVVKLSYHTHLQTNGVAKYNSAIVSFYQK